MEQNNELKITINQESKNTNKTFSLDKSSLFIIVLLFMFSSKLWDIAWDIGKSLLYIIIIIYLIGFVNQDLADNIKSIIHDFTNINSNNNFISNLLAKLLSPLTKIINLNKVEKEIIKPETKIEKNKTITNTNTNTNLSGENEYLNGPNTKNLSNTPRSNSKNIFI